MKTQDLELQDAILLSIHWTEDIEEARQKELWFWCSAVLLLPTDWCNWVHTEIHTITSHSLNVFNGKHCTNYRDLITWIEYTIKTIIGKPPTLARVLKALWDDYSYAYNSLVSNLFQEETRKVCERQLLDDQGNDMSLRDQSQETKDAIYSLICN